MAKERTQSGSKSTNENQNYGREKYEKEKKNATEMYRQSVKEDKQEIATRTRNRKGKETRCTKERDDKP